MSRIFFQPSTVEVSTVRFHFMCFIRGLILISMSPLDIEVEFYIHVLYDSKYISKLG